MKKFIFIISIFAFYSCAELQAILGDTGQIGGKPLSQEEVIRGLKSALEVGTDTAVNLLARTNGFMSDQAVRILLPQEINTSINQLRSTSAGQTIYNNTIKKLEEDMILSLNRAAENATQKAAPIFKNAIRNMTVQDGFNILRGADNAATLYLRGQTYAPLSNAFKPDVNQALRQPLVLNMSSERIYNEFVDAYNTVVRNDRLNLLNINQLEKRDLGQYVVEKALDGLFLKIADEEKDIRNDPRARVNDILRRVFG